MMGARAVAVFWRVVDSALTPELRAGSPEGRAQARFVSAASVLVVLMSAIVYPLDLLRPGAAPNQAIASFLAGLGLFAALRWRGNVRETALVFLFLLVFLGPGFHAMYPEPGSPNLVWVLVVGFSPLLVPSVPITLAATLVALVGAMWVVSPASPVPVSASLGDVVPVVATAWLVTAAGLTIHRVAVEEHGARLLAEQALEARTVEATASLTARASDTASFLTTMSHELRTPLNGVLGLADLLTLEDVSPAARERLVQIHGAGRSLLRAFDTLLCLTRMTASGVSPTQPLDLPGICDAALTKALHAAGGEPPTLQLALAPGTPRIVQANLTVLRTVLDQLIGSALDAGVTRVTLEVAVRDGVIDVRLVGAHAGVVPKSASERSPLSLGIPLAAELAQAAGGACSPVLGSARGLTVTVTLPCDPVETPEALAL